MSVRDYNATPASNTAISGTDISEGCSPAGINNAIRQQMADIKDVSTGAVALESPAVDQLNFADNAKAIFGNASDLQIYHNGGNSIISDVGTGDLYVAGDNLRLTNAALSEVYARGYANGKFSLYYDNAEKLATTATGVDVTGTVTADGLTVEGTSQFYNSTAPTLNNDTHAGEALFLKSGGTAGNGNVQAVLAFGKADGSTNRSGSAIGSIQTDTDVDKIGIGFYTSDGSASSQTMDERMRIDSGGTVIFGASSTVAPSLSYRPDSSGGYIEKNSNSTGATTAYDFKINGTRVGSITTSGSSTAYNTSSDYRLKENVVADWDATTRLKQLNPVRFNFIADADTTVDGFLAHEVQSVVPEAISGTHNEVDDDGNAVMQGIDQSKLVPLLTGALQEAIAKIEQLETRIAALEA